jgi:hypothetical protein
MLFVHAVFTTQTDRCSLRLGVGTVPKASWLQIAAKLVLS